MNTINFSSFRKAYAEILRSKIFDLLMAWSLDLLVFRGYMVFLPKCLEMQFGMPQYDVHILMASFSIFELAMNAIISDGIIVRRHKFIGREIATLILVFSIINSASFSKAFFGYYSIASSIGATDR